MLQCLEAAELMLFKWKRLWRRRHDSLQPDLDMNTASLKQQSSSFMSAVYDRTVRTDSYNEIVMKIEVLAGEMSANVASFVSIDELLEPTQEDVDAMLHKQTDTEIPEMMQMAMDFFENSRKVSLLCGTLLQCIYVARHQCGRMEATLADMPLSGEALGFMQQQVMAEGLSEMLEAKNPFTEAEAGKMFVDVGKRYGALSSKVEERRSVVGRRVR
eukprot:c37335_g1_i1 orf=146-790(+)